MKTFSQFIQEAKDAKSPKEVLNKISRAYGKRYRGVNVDASHDRSGDIRLNNIWIPPEERNKGIGSRIMKGLSKYADKQNKRITLNQAPEKGKKAKLQKFYQSHGFQPNKGRNREFTTRDTYIRYPQMESKARQDVESSRYEDNTYRSTKEKINDPRLKKLRRFFNRELGRYTV